MLCPDRCGAIAFVSVAVKSFLSALYLQRSAEREIHLIDF
jgi:hypothetical protein